MKTQELLESTDAMAWAQEFVKTLREHPDTADSRDEGFMVGWFANAIETGRRAEERRPRRHALRLFGVEVERDEDCHVWASRPVGAQAWDARGNIAAAFWVALKRKRSDS